MCFANTDADQELDMRRKFRRRERKVELARQRDERGSRQVWARLTADGAVVIEGVDVGLGVTEWFGEGHNEYEWAYTIAPNDVRLLLDAAGGSDRDQRRDPLDTLQSSLSDEEAFSFHAFLDRHDIPHKLWTWLS
jgi:hypothetical protein